MPALPTSTPTTTVQTVTRTVTSIISETVLSTASSTVAQVTQSAGHSSLDDLGESVNLLTIGSMALRISAAAIALSYGAGLANRAQIDNLMRLVDVWRNWLNSLTPEHRAEILQHNPQLLPELEEALDEYELHLKNLLIDYEAAGCFSIARWGYTSNVSSRYRNLHKKVYKLHNNVTSSTSSYRLSAALSDDLPDSLKQGQAKPPSPPNTAASQNAQDSQSPTPSNSPAPSSDPSNLPNAPDAPNSKSSLATMRAQFSAAMGAINVDGLTDFGRRLVGFANDTVTDVVTWMH